MKDDSISTTISQDTELEMFHARYHKTDEKLKHIVSHQKYNDFKKSLQNLGENLNPLNQDEKSFSFGMRRNGTLNEEANQTH